MILVVSFAEGFKAVPSEIEIGYNEQVEVEFGVYNLDTGEFDPPFAYPFLNTRIVSFDTEFPDGNPGGVWFVNYNPPNMIFEEGKPLTTKMTISLTSPANAEKAIQSTIIRVKVTDTWAFGNAWWTEGPDTPLWYKASWFFMALTGGWGDLSGQVLPEYHDFDLLVKVKPYHNAKIEAMAPEKLRPNQITSIPVIVQNLGNYNDTISFRISGDDKNKLKITDEGTITLNPGEIGNTYVGVAVPPNLIDTGSLNSITLEAYSIEEPNVTIANQRLFFETSGIYLSDLNLTIAFGILFLFLLGSVFISYIRKKRHKKIHKNDLKPWLIPIEKNHLQELRIKDKKAFYKERLMMEHEYKSALMWHKDNKKLGIIKKQATKKNATNEKQVDKKENIFKKIFIKSEEKTEKIKQQTEKKEEEKPIEEKTIEKSDKITEQNQKTKILDYELECKKQIALEKIKRAQEKQKKKLKNKSNGIF